MLSCCIITLISLKVRAGSDQSAENPGGAESVMEAMTVQNDDGS